MVISPSTTPNVSSSTLTSGTKQFVVQLAAEITLWDLRSNVLWLTPNTNVASAPVHGADTRTRGAPASRWYAAVSRVAKKPVDSTTTSTPRSPHGSAFGSRSDNTRSSSSPTLMPVLVAFTDPGSWPSTESYLRRCAIVSIEPRSLTATKSMSAPRCFAARKKLRPIRPKPLIPTRTVISRSVLSSKGRKSRWHRLHAWWTRRPVRGDRAGHPIAGVDATRRPDRRFRCRRCRPTRCHPDRATSRCDVRTATPRSRNRRANSSAIATDRCRPPVHPIATVR